MIGPDDKKSNRFAADDPATTPASATIKDHFKQANNTISTSFDVDNDHLAKVSSGHHEHGSDKNEQASAPTDDAIYSTPPVSAGALSDGIPSSPPTKTREEPSGRSDEPGVDTKKKGWPGALAVFKRWRRSPKRSGTVRPSSPSVLGVVKSTSTMPPTQAEIASSNATESEASSEDEQQQGGEHGDLDDEGAMLETNQEEEEEGPSGDNTTSIEFVHSPLETLEAREDAVEVVCDLTPNRMLVHVQCG